MPTSLRVLICEDDPVQAMLLEDIVYRAGHRPIGPAKCFVEALEIVDANRIDAAIVDINLSDGRSGPLIARHLQDRCTKIIVMSGSDTVDPDLASIRHVFVAKPAPAAVIEALLGASRPRAEEAEETAA